MSQLFYEMLLDEERLQLSEKEADLIEQLRSGKISWVEYDYALDELQENSRTSSSSETSSLSCSVSGPVHVPEEHVSSNQEIPTPQECGIIVDQYNISVKAMKKCQKKSVERKNAAKLLTDAYKKVLALKDHYSAAKDIVTEYDSNVKKRKDKHDRLAKKSNRVGESSLVTPQKSNVSNHNVELESSSVPAKNAVSILNEQAPVVTDIVRRCEYDRMLIGLVFALGFSLVVFRIL
jgi:hypothetical protein